MGGILNCDLAIIGAGPAGCAAAIAAQRAGLQTILLEAQAKPGPAPGETLHPGVEVIFRQLGVWDEILAAGFHRHEGVWRVVAGRRSFVPYGADGNGPWLGLQADRRTLHLILQNGALEAGAQILRPARPTGVLRRGNRVAGIALGDSAINARWVIDASGRRAWLARALELTANRLDSDLRVRFGWTKAECPDLGGNPLFNQYTDGWEWRAPLGQGRLAWVTLSFSPAIAGSRNQGGGGMDLTWRCYRNCAGPGYFMTGDAAMLLDPASSNGVLRALMSAMLAVHLIGAVRREELDADAASRAYNAAINQVFDHCAAELRELYFAAGAKRARSFPRRGKAA